MVQSGFSRAVTTRRWRALSRVFVSGPDPQHRRNRGARRTSSPLDARSRPPETDAAVAAAHATLYRCLTEGVFVKSA